MVTLGRLDRTPIGPVYVAASDTELLAVSLWDDVGRLAAGVARLTTQEVALSAPPGPVVVAALGQLDEYLHGQRQTFDLPLPWPWLKPLERAVLEHVHTVPFGRTTTYGAIATALGRPGLVRAVGQVNANNPLPLVIPCHRVAGSDGRLRGYGAPGGVETKAWLLQLERSVLL